MTGLDPVIYAFFAAPQDMDGRIKSGHDELSSLRTIVRRAYGRAAMPCFFR